MAPIRFHMLAQPIIGWAFHFGSLIKMAGMYRKKVRPLQVLVNIFYIVDMQIFKPYFYPIGTI